MRSLMRAVSKAADCTLLVLEIDAEFDEGRQQSLLVLEIDAEFDEGRQQSRRLHPAGTGDRCGV